MIIDLSAVTGAGPETVNLLCGVLRRATRRNATLTLAGGSPQLRRVIERSEIDGVDLYPTVEALVPWPAAAPPVSSTSVLQPAHDAPQRKEASA